MRRISIVILVGMLGCQAMSSVDNADVNQPDAGDTQDLSEVEEVSEDAADLNQPEADEVDQPDLLAVPDECTKASEQSDCDDDVACTDDLCMKGVCQNLADALACDDNNACTIDTCEKDVVINGGCHHKVRPCEDGNPCTLNACDIAIGCTFTQNDPAACAGLGDECTTAVCVSGQGCTLVSNNCDDGQLDTIDVCAKDIGCVNTVVECGNDFSQCVPSNPCVTASCQSGVCVEQVKVCDDSIACTKDVCDSNGLCQHLPINDLCPFIDNVCVQSLCDVNFGCTQLGVLCDDGNVCTSDFCLEGQGCTAQKIQGCCLDSDDCQDGDACTQDNCEVDGHCAYIAVLCDDGLVCTVDECIPSGTYSYCNFIPDCDDGDLCTYDSCNFVSGLCEYKSETCWEGFICDPGSGKCALKEGACETYTDCDDDNQCTWDVCTNHTCENTVSDGPSWCQGANVCETGMCVDGVCVVKQDTLCILCSVNEDCPSNIVCDGLKKSVEYLGSCDNQGTCEYSTQICSSSPCQSSSCVDGNGCYYEPKCNDDDPCTTDPCNWSTGECEPSHAICETDNVCMFGTCNSNGSEADVSCTYKPVDCDDNDVTTDDFCDYKQGCQHVPIN